MPIGTVFSAVITRNVLKMDIGFQSKYFSKLKEILKATLDIQIFSKNLVVLILRDLWRQRGVDLLEGHLMVTLETLARCANAGLDVLGGL